MSEIDSRVFEMENISVRRGKSEILRQIDWTVNEGEHWVVIGGNGSGKTSLLRVLMGYFTPTTGEVFSSRSQGRVGFRTSKMG